MSIATSLVKANAAIGQNFGSRGADTGHQFALFIYVVIPRVENAIVVANSDQMAENYLAAGIFGPDDVAVLMIMKRGIGTDFAGRRIFDRCECAAVVADLHFR